MVKFTHSSGNFEDANIKIHYVKLDNSKIAFDLQGWEWLLLSPSREGGRGLPVLILDPQPSLGDFLFSSRTPDRSLQGVSTPRPPSPTLKLPRYLSLLGGWGTYPPLRHSL